MTEVWDRADPKMCEGRRRFFRNRGASQISTTMSTLGGSGDVSRPRGPGAKKGTTRSRCGTGDIEADGEDRREEGRGKGWRRARHTRALGCVRERLGEERRARASRTRERFGEAGEEGEVKKKGEKKITRETTKDQPNFCLSCPVRVGS